jgi:4-hydroxythreonine-4-phosphate dehydrogenase
MGDPRGIGPEVLLKALQRTELPQDVGLVVIGDEAVLRAEAGRMGLAMELEVAEDPGAGRASRVLLQVGEFPASRLEPRQPDAAAGQAALDYVEQAVRLALAGRVNGLVTGPISKEAIAEAGSPFTGHTEMLADLTGSGRSVMLMVAGELRVALVTTHIALRDVPGAIVPANVVATAAVLADGLRRYFGLAEPRLALCGLNPHCGDGGLFGDEEARLLAPAVERARREGVALEGPKPSDTLFLEAARGEYDAVLALYHDQGMIPVKLSGLGRVVNVTLGLPFVRTSVGHGTAFDIAGRGLADEGSLVEAVRLAASMVRAARSEGDA